VEEVDISSSIKPQVAIQMQENSESKKPTNLRQSHSRREQPGRSPQATSSKKSLQNEPTNVDEELQRTSVMSQ